MPGAGLEELLGEDPVVALDFAVVAGCVGRDPLLPGGKHGLGEDLGPIAGSVVGDDPLDHIDAVRGEPCRRALKESGCSHSLFIVKDLGVGEPGVTVDRGVEVDVSAPCAAFLGPLNSASLEAVTSVHTPAAAIRDSANLLHVNMNHVARTFGKDRQWLSVRFPVRAEKSATVETKL